MAGGLAGWPDQPDDRLPQFASHPHSLQPDPDGLLLPLSPGALLLLLAAWLIELAFLLRRPFIASAH